MKKKVLLAAALVVCLAAVSYTHLDVYKRQTQAMRKMGVSRSTFYRLLAAR